MCYDISYLNRLQEKVEKRYNVNIPQNIQLPVFYHVKGFAHPDLPVITSERPEVVQLYQWGLIPVWCKDEKQAREMQHQTLNAIGETVFEKPSYRSSILKNRCLLLVDGFYEWHTIRTPGVKKEEKVPFRIRMKTDETFALGCVYNDWVNRDTGEVHHTFSILTVAANPLLARIHNSKKRMPLILPPGRERDWIERDLGREDIQHLIQPLDENFLEAYSISKRITSRTLSSNVPEVMEPHEYPGLKI
jgi:putative SOS response-associated peptidase YedK